jgi:hypothetical protein
METNGTEDLHMKVYSYMLRRFFTKVPKIYNGGEKKTASSTNVAGKIVYLHAEN